MKIVSYKRKNNGQYIIYFDNGKNFTFYEEIILNHRLLLKKSITEEEVEKLSKENQNYESYYIALKLINKVAKTAYEVEEYLKQKGFTEKEIDQAVTKLKKQGYLNDKIYAKSFVHNQLLTTSRGPKKIIQELEKRKVTKEDYQEAMEAYTEEEERKKIVKTITKAVKSNQRKSIMALKKKLETTLILAGFDRYVIQEELQKVSLEEDKELVRKEYNKTYKKLSKKYSGKELEYRVRQKMYSLGFSCQEEWGENENL